MEGIIIGINELMNISTLLFLVGGVMIGLVVGTLPGMNDNITIAVLIPITFGMEPQHGLSLLVGIYCATCFGGSFPAILLNIPGTASSVVTTFDGYPMAKKGLAGQALGISTVSSVIGGVISGFTLLLFAPVLAQQALKFGPTEYFSLIILGFCTVIGMATGNVVKSMIAVIIGLFISTIGMSPQTGEGRFTFGNANLLDGIPLVTLMIGLFGVTAVFEMIFEAVTKKTDGNMKVGRILPDKKLFKRILPTTLISGTMGTAVGILPGAGMIMAIYLAYDSTVRRLKNKVKNFGKGAPEGVAAPEAANNAVVASSMIPLISLGIPGNSVSALFIGALMIHGLQPGPALFKEAPEISYLLLVAFLAAYIFIFPLGLLMAKFLTSTIMKVPKDLLGATVVVLCFTGAFAFKNSLFDFWIIIVFGVIGFIFNRLNIPFSALILAVVLGKLLEKSYHQSMVLSNGSYSIFFEKPISLTLLIVSFLFIAWPVITGFRKKEPIT
ncbi:tripartite tricarboxylate transporter permease [Sporosarcina sp. FSL K6-3508]|uniref:tripartite tricarboxylate transporter permease n=1 Tax=Sporosarcina sp. FSL K6-3508 TaxID=2921557 RepID=UPI00315AFF5C